jgi:hypothetical protein
MKETALLTILGLHVAALIFVVYGILKDRRFYKNLKELENDEKKRERRER